jgi:hypothetical protein
MTRGPKNICVLLELQGTVDTSEILAAAGVDADDFFADSYVQGFLEGLDVNQDGKVR